MEHIGIDLHQKYSEVCCLSEEGELLGKHRVATTEAGLHRVLGARAGARVVIESSSLSPWVGRLLRSWGLEVVVVNPRRVRLIAESTLKNDALDAELLARLGRLDVGLLGPVYQRSEAAQKRRTRLRVRASLVKARTAMINTVRGSLRSAGVRVGSCSSERFAARFCELALEEEWMEILRPLVETIGELSERIVTLDQKLRAEARSDELLKRLQTVPGVGPVVSHAYTAWMDRPERFSKSRDVGACLGLRPRMRDSGGRERRGSITREGDTQMRCLLVQAAHAALHSRKDSALKRWAEALAKRKGKKKAIVALARKIAIILHRIWITGDSFRAFPQALS